MDIVFKACTFHSNVLKLLFSDTIIVVPEDFHEVLMSYTKHGYRVLALAHRELPEKLKHAKIQKLQRYMKTCNF